MAIFPQCRSAFAASSVTEEGCSFLNPVRFVTAGVLSGDSERVGRGLIVLFGSFDGVESVNAGLGVVHVFTLGSQFAKPGFAKDVGEEQCRLIAGPGYGVFGRTENAGEAGGGAI
jgi:hypothetical protein